MSHTVMTEIHFLALDGGGTRCRAVICDRGGTERARVTGGSANLTSDFDAAHRNIEDVITYAYREAGMPEDARSSAIAVLGVAGAETGDAAARLSAQLSFAASKVVSDRDIAVAGVLGQTDGTLAQIGTGSFFVTRRSGVTRHAGGWGLVLGDECSGAWLGREVLRTTMKAHDGLGDSSPLTAEIMSEFEEDPYGVVLFARDASPADFAAYAPRLFAGAEDGDAVARAILRHAACELERVLTIIEDGAAPPLYLCGGVGERFVPLVSEDLRARVNRPKGDGLDGALSMARQLYRAG